MDIHILHLSSTAAYPVLPMLLPSAGCGWRCVWLPAAHQCSSRCWAPGCSRAGATSPAAAPRPGTPPPLCCPLHTVEKTSYFKCLKVICSKLEEMNYTIAHELICLFIQQQPEWCGVYGEPGRAWMKHHHAAMIWHVLSVALNLLYSQGKWMCSYLSFLCFLFLGQIWMTIG